MVCSNTDCTFFVNGNAALANGTASIGSFNAEHLCDGKGGRSRALKAELFRPLVPGLGGLHGQGRRGDSAQVAPFFIHLPYTNALLVADEGIHQGECWWD